MRAKFAVCLKFCTAVTPGNDGDGDPRRARPVEEAEIEVIVEEELGDGPRRAGVDLGLEHVDVLVEARAFRVLLRIGGNRDFEIAYGAQARHQIGRMGVAARRRRIGRSQPPLRIAAQRHDMAHAGVPIAARDFIHLFARRADAGEMRSRLDRGFADDAGDRRVGAFPGGAAGAISDGDEFRLQRREALDRVPQRRLHFRRFWREEFEGHVDRLVLEAAPPWFLSLRFLSLRFLPPCILHGQCPSFLSRRACRAPARGRR